MNVLPETFSLSAFHARTLTPADIKPLQALAEADPDYFEIVKGAPPACDEAEALMADLPPDKTLDDKFLYGLFEEDDALAGVVDLIRDYPEARHWYLGLLFVHPRHRGRGHGARIMADLNALLRDAGAEWLRHAVIERNVRALRFWRHMGFQEKRRLQHEARSGLSLPLIEMGREM